MCFVAITPAKKGVEALNLQIFPSQFVTSF